MFSDMLIIGLSLAGIVQSIVIIALAKILVNTEEKIYRYDL